MKVAAYQAPLLEAGSMDAIRLIRTRVRACEAGGVSILCCPEAVLGGLADNARDLSFAIAGDDKLAAVLAPLASDVVTTIVGFTELADEGRLYNSAAVLYRGSVVAVYRKLYPAINHSVYDAGRAIPVFQLDALTFGIVICNDSTHPEPARLMAAQGATALFVPANNGMPLEKGGAGLVAESRSADIRLAVENGLWVIRADVAGRAGALASHGSSAIVDPDGIVVKTAKPMAEDLLVVEIATTRRARRAE
jgi:predicted amidohydrolase